MATHATEHCENCGSAIGTLETPWLHNDHVVCAACWKKLSGDNPPAMQSPVVVSQVRHTQTVEQTGKIWKAQILLSSLLIAVGIIMYVVAVSRIDESGQESSANSAAIGVAMFVVGLLWFLFARIGSWWFHG